MPHPAPAPTRHRSGSLLATLFLAAGSLVSPAAEPLPWPEWRGPGAEGHAAVTGLPLTWSETNNVLWKAPVGGRGHSSPAIGQGRVWLTTAFETPAKPEDAERRKKGTTNDQPLTMVDEVRLHAVALDFATGKVLHDVEVFRLREPQGVHALNSYASPSPVLEAGRVYVHYGALGTACLDAATGHVLWRNQELLLNHENGPGGSPVLWNDLLILHGDGSDVQFVAALDKTTGKVRWKTARTGKLADHPQLKKAYGTPRLADFAGRTELLSVAADWLYSYDPASGRELWKLPYGLLGFSNVPRPVLGHGMIYLSTGFMRSELLAVKYDGQAPATVAWRWKRGVPQTPSLLLVGNELYFVTDSGGLLTCLDATTGAEIYQERLGGNHSASPSYADGRIYFHDRAGVTAVIQPGRRFELLARNALDGPIMASAAFADRSMLLRTDKALYRVGARH